MRGSKRRRAGGDTSTVHQLITAAALLTSQPRQRPTVPDPYKALTEALAISNLPGACPVCRTDSQVDGVVQCGSCERWSLHSCAASIPVSAAAGVTCSAPASTQQRCSRCLLRRCIGRARDVTTTTNGINSSGGRSVPLLLPRLASDCSTGSGLHTLQLNDPAQCADLLAEVQNDRVMARDLMQLAKRLNISHKEPCALRNLVLRALQKLPCNPGAAPWRFRKPSEVDRKDLWYLQGLQSKLQTDSLMERDVRSCCRAWGLLDGTARRTLAESKAALELHIVQVLCESGTGEQTVDAELDDPDGILMQRSLAQCNAVAFCCSCRQVISAVQPSSCASCELPMHVQCAAASWKCSPCISMEQLLSTQNAQCSQQLRPVIFSAAAARARRQGTAVSTAFADKQRFGKLPSIARCRVLASAQFVCFEATVAAMCRSAGARQAGVGWQLDDVLGLVLQWVGRLVPLLNCVAVSRLWLFAASQRDMQSTWRRAQLLVPADIESMETASEVRKPELLPHRMIGRQLAAVIGPMLQQRLQGPVRVQLLPGFDHLLDLELNTPLHLQGHSAVLRGVLKLSGSGGAIHGLTFLHHYYNCVTVISGDWKLSDCRFQNSNTKKPLARASLAIEVRGGECSVSNSVIETCTRGVTVAGGATLLLQSSVLEGNREAVSGDGDAQVMVRDCEFLENVTAFQFSNDVCGEICRNVLSHSNIWGYGQPPAKVLCYENRVLS